METKAKVTMVRGTGAQALRDALEAGLAFADDALVVSLMARKEYGEPGAEVTITEIGGQEQWLN